MLIQAANWSVYWEYKVALSGTNSIWRPVVSGVLQGLITEARIV